jgi:hypothetical protein
MNMCDVCNLEGLDWVFATGGKKLVKNKLYKVYTEKAAQVKLCTLHDIELFKFGEKKFLSAHLKLSRNLISMSVDEDDFDF